MIKYLYTFNTIVDCNRMAYNTIKENFRAGMSENDAYRMITDAYKSIIPSGVSFCGYIIGGINSANIEGTPTDNVLHYGDTLILDLQPMYNGVVADDGT